MSTRLGAKRLEKFATRGKRARDSAAIDAAVKALISLYMTYSENPAMMSPTILGYSTYIGAILTTKRILVETRLTEEPGYYLDDSKEMAEGQIAHLSQMLEGFDARIGSLRNLYYNCVRFIDAVSNPANYMPMTDEVMLAGMRDVKSEMEAKIDELTRLISEVAESLEEAKLLIQHVSILNKEAKIRRLESQVPFWDAERARMIATWNVAYEAAKAEASAKSPPWTPPRWRWVVSDELMRLSPIDKWICEDEKWYHYAKGTAKCHGGSIAQELPVGVTSWIEMEEKSWIEVEENDVASVESLSYRNVANTTLCSKHMRPQGMSRREYRNGSTSVRR